MSQSCELRGGQCILNQYIIKEESCLAAKIAHIFGGGGANIHIY
jgi:hypothetical protein